MTPEDVRKKEHIDETCAKNGDNVTEDVRENIIMKLVWTIYPDIADVGLSPEDHEKWGKIADLITSAKAEGYAEGVKAMQEAVKDLSITVDTNNLEDGPESWNERYTLAVSVKDIVQAAAQLLSPQKENRE